MEIKAFFNTVFLTTAVFAALISSIANVIISLINNHRLKKIEEKKQINEIDKYRYSKLYELVADWHKYDSPIEGETADEMLFKKSLTLFENDSIRYEIAKPLLDKCYVEILENNKNECQNLRDALVEVSAHGTDTEDFQIIAKKYFSSAREFSELLKKEINIQLEVLLRKNNT